MRTFPPEFMNKILQSRHTAAHMLYISHEVKTQQ